MAKPFSNYESNRFSSDVKQRLALDALKSENISETAKGYNTTRRTVYTYRNKAANAVNAVNDAFNAQQPDDKVLYYIPVTKSYIESAVTGLFGIGKVSERDTQLYLHYIFDYDISIGSINTILSRSSDSAHSINQSYSFESCQDSTSDECYHRGDPILSVADIPSKFCLLLEREDYLDHSVWEMYLDDLKERGYSPAVNVLDGGSEMNLAYENIFEKTTLRYDHFHIIKTIKELLRFLKNKCKSTYNEALNRHKRFLNKTIRRQ